MAQTEYTIGPGEVGVYGIVLTPSVECVIRFAEELPAAELLNLSGDAELYVTADNTPATIGGRNTRAMFAGMGTGRVEFRTGGPCVVRVVSPGSPRIGVCKL